MAKGWGKVHVKCPSTAESGEEESGQAGLVEAIWRRTELGEAVFGVGPKAILESSQHQTVAEAITAATWRTREVVGRGKSGFELRAQRSLAWLVEDGAEQGREGETGEMAARPGICAPIGGRPAVEERCTAPK